MAAEHSKQNVIEVEEAIRTTAELIFDFLFHKSEMELEQLREKVTHQMPFFDWAIGWLVGKGDIQIRRHEGTFIVRREGPTPVVIPLRGA
jgi:hypothetical protein